MSWQTWQTGVSWIFHQWRYPKSSASLFFLIGCSMIFIIQLGHPAMRPSSGQKTAAPDPGDVLHKSVPWQRNPAPPMVETCWNYKVVQVLWNHRTKLLLFEMFWFWEIRKFHDLRISMDFYGFIKAFFPNMAISGLYPPVNVTWLLKITQLFGKSAGHFPNVFFQWIGLRENLQETMVFTIKYRGFL